MHVNLVYPSKQARKKKNACRSIIYDASVDINARFP